MKSLSTLRIKGILGTSLLDFPGQISAIVFLGGCNLVCSFCHNPDLIPKNDVGCIDVEEILSTLETRKQFIDGVVVTGGEPTLQEDLESFLRKIKDMGLLVKLDTNGLKPDVLANVISKKLVDYVAMDIKTSLDRYGELGDAGGGAKVLESLEVLKGCGLEYEIRTTMVPKLITETDINNIGQALDGVRNWVLQQFTPETSASLRKTKAYSKEVLEGMLSVARTYVADACLRGS